MRRLVAAVLAVAAAVTAPSTASAQVVQGPTYATPGAFAPMTLTAWTEIAGSDANGSTLYRHWFTGTMRLGGFFTGPGETMTQTANMVIHLAPWDLFNGAVPPGTPPNPYTACGCFGYALSGTVGAAAPPPPPGGFAVAINTASTMGAILTTLPGFIAPSYESGTWFYVIRNTQGPGDQDLGGDIVEFRVTAAAPDAVTATPEPATLGLLAAGLLPVAVIVRRRKRSA